MSNAFSLDHRMNIKTVVWPILVEHAIRMSMMAVDVFMLSQYSDDAVAAVGLTGHFIFFLMLMYMIVSTGCAVLVGQHLGAKQSAESQAYSQSGFLLSLIIAILVGGLCFVGSAPLIALYQLEPAVEQFAIEYSIITGSLSIGVSVSIILSTILRAYGYSKSPMVIQLISGFINVIGNYIALFGPFGLPVTGVVGVAVATVVSQLLAAGACLVVIKFYRLPFSLRQSFKLDIPRFTKILKLGLPNAGESISYNLAQITIMFFVAQLGTAALAATAIAQTLARFIFIFAMSVGNGSQILSSYMVGQARIQELKRNVHRYWMFGVAVSLAISILLVIGREPIAALFTQDAETQALIGVLFIVSLFLEPGRAINLIVISSLKGAGDVVFPVQIGILSMWGVGVCLAYVFGIHWAFGVAGIWFAVGVDEWVRGVIVIMRWHREKWVDKSQVNTAKQS